MQPDQYRLTLAFLIALLIPSAAHAGAIRFVDDDAPLGGNGLAWNTAYRFLQDALADASAGGVAEIRIAQGTYTPDRDEAGNVTPGDREAAFELVDAVAMRGGFAGITHPDPGDRDISLYETVLSGDLLGDDGAEFANNGDNSRHVLLADGMQETVLEGLTVTAGNASGGFFLDESGAGLLANPATVTLDQCTFRANSAQRDGGGIFASFSTLDLTSCILEDNRSLGELGEGGGALLAFDSDLALSECIVRDNTSTNITAGIGGAAFEGPATFTMVGCTVTANASAVGSAGVLVADVDAAITDCTITDNEVTGEDLAVGGGIGMTGVGTGSLVMTNTLVEGNTALEGAGISASGALTAVNCTIADNVAGERAGGIDGRLATVSVENSILWGNVDPGLSVEAAQITGDGPISVDFSTIQGLTGNLGGTGNIGDDPLFADADNGDFRLSPGSPAVDAALNAAVPGDVTADLDGNPRFLEIPETPDCQQAPGACGELPVVDMGAYESLGGGCLAITAQEVACHGDGTTFTVDIEGLNNCTGGTSSISITGSGGEVGEELCATVIVNDDASGAFCCSTEICVAVPDCAPAACPCDLDGDGVVGIPDVLALLSAWGQTPDGPRDLDGNGAVGVHDLLELLAQWGQCP